MSNQKNGISWTDETLNVVTGCTPVSEGCAHCYAARMAKRPIGDFTGGRKFSEIRLHPDRLEKPLHWKKPRKIFICSMSDLFHPAVPDEFIDKVFAMMALCPQHTFQLLTKRPERMLAYLTETATEGGRLFYGIPPDWIWLGVSCEDQAAADERIPLLLQTPAVVRYVSFEPLLGPIKLSRHHAWCPTHDFDGGFCTGECSDRRYLNWAICGPETGPKRRIVSISDVRSLADQCVSAGIPFHLKAMEIYGKIVKKPELDGKQWLEFPEGKA